MSSAEPLYWGCSSTGAVQRIWFNGCPATNDFVECCGSLPKPGHPLGVRVPVGPCARAGPQRIEIERMTRMRGCCMARARVRGGVRDQSTAVEGARGDEAVLPRPPLLVFTAAQVPPSW